MPEVKWIKIVTDIFDDEKMLLIESMPEADAIIVIWFKILCFAGKQNNSGVFTLNDRIAYTDEMLATIFRRNLNTVRLALDTFERFGMIERIENIITIPNWNKHQSLDAYERRKERDRIYQAEKRAVQKQIAAQSADASADSSSDVGSLEYKNKKENKNKNNTTANAFEAFAGENAELLDSLKAFEEMRKAIKKPVTNKARELLCKQLEKFPADQWIPIINQSIEHSWQGFYELKGYQRSFPKKCTEINPSEISSDEIERIKNAFLIKDAF